MYWTTDCILHFKWGLHINPCIIWTGRHTVYFPSNGDSTLTHVSYVLDNRLYITLLMGITHKHMYHMYWTTDCILPF